MDQSKKNVGKPAQQNAVKKPVQRKSVGEKVLLKEKIKAARHDSKIEKPVDWKYGKYFLAASIMIIVWAAYYFYFNYIFYYQEKLTLFIYSDEYLKQFASKPGGLLEYTGNFLAQGYFSSIYGALILAVIFALTGMVFFMIGKRISSHKPAGIPVSLLMAGLAISFLILMQTNINYLMHNNLGFLLTGLYFLVLVSSQAKGTRIIVLAFFPVFFCLTGAFAWIFLGMAAIYGLINKRFIFTAVLIFTAGLTLLLFKEVIFFQTWTGLAHYPLPLKEIFTYPSTLLLLVLFFILYPAFIYLLSIINASVKYQRILSAGSLLLPVLLTLYFLAGNYNKATAGMFDLEKRFLAGDWEEVIKQQESYRYRNPVAQYYYNISLSEKDLLCDRLFFAPQDFGTMSISIPWDSRISINKMFRGIYFFYSIGLINEAHRWAFESMVIQGFHPENIRLLIKTNLINGHYRIAEKYISVLKRTLHYRIEAKTYEKMLSNPELIRSDPELGEKILLKPHDDFIVRIGNPQKNITALFESNPANRKAFEYMIAWFLLEKDFEQVVNNIGRLPAMGYSKIPQHMEEAALVYRTAAGRLPYKDSPEISSESDSRFSRYILTVSGADRRRSPEGTSIQKEFGNTYWYYLDFVNPRSE
ncbi:MAG: DUF6057 family protein [Bacteroidales bacterium]|jgi:hypothetical protein|nr:DUF6057 family protein [Bacteroidales bacterium]